MATEIFIPKMGANIEEVEIGRVNVSSGDVVEKGDIIMEIVTNKATFDVEAEASGKILSLTCKEGDSLKVLDVVGYIGEDGEEFVKQEVVEVRATPAAKKIAKEHGVSIDKEFYGVSSVVKEGDILKLIGDGTQGDKKIVDVSLRKRAEIKNLSYSKDLIVSSVTVEVSAFGLDKRLKELEKNLGLRLTSGNLVSFEVAKALKKFPELNAYYDSSEEKIVLFGSVDLGIAINLDGDNLIVPVIKGVDSMELGDFVRANNDLIMNAGRGKLSAEEMGDSTFTITDLSSSGVYDFSPVINKNQSAILGISSTHDSVSLDGGKIVYDPKIHLTLAFDHRVIDGKKAAMFLNEVKKNLVG
jgi:pyruvate/2-oxoglutarate dehydrogenase complex dihydrolipoamide acyltransferase (E2) component